VANIAFMKNKKLQWGIIITLILIALFFTIRYFVKKAKQPTTQPNDTTKPCKPGEKPIPAQIGWVCVPKTGGGNGGTGTASAAVFPLQEGMQGNSVKSVQNKLNNCYKYSSISPTGILDKDTKYALGSMGFPLPLAKSDWNKFMAATNCRS